MNPISKVTSAITHPIRMATTVADEVYGVAAAGVRTTMHILSRAAGQGRGSGEATPADSTAPPATPAPAPRETATKASRKQATAQKAPSARAATVAPALAQTDRETVEEDELRTPSGVPAADEGHNPDTTDTDLHQPGTEPLMDPATVKSARSEAEVMQRAADVDKS